MSVAKEFDQKATQTDILFEQSKIFIAMNQPDKLLRLAKEALVLATASKYKIGVMNSYAQIGKAYGLLKNYEQAYVFQNRYIALKDSLRDEDNVSNIQRLHYSHELGKKEAEIDPLVHLSSIYCQPLQS